MTMLDNHEMSPRQLMNVVALFHTCGTLRIIMKREGGVQEQKGTGRVCFSHSEGSADCDLLRHFRLLIKQCGYIVCSVSEDVFDGNIREVQHKHFILLKNTVLQGRD